MKNAVAVVVLGICGSVFCATSCSDKQTEKDYTVYVNPFIGTGGHGHTFPCPVAIITCFTGKLKQFFTVRIFLYFLLSKSVKKAKKRIIFKLTLAKYSGI